MYYCIGWVKTKNGWVPDLPEDTGFLHIINPCKKSSWGIFEISNADFIDEIEDGLHKEINIEPVSEGLRCLLDSCSIYPPALAFAKEEIENCSVSKSTSREDFSKIFAGVLHKNLNKQSQDNYVLAEVLVADGHYNRKGRYYWIVGYTPKINLVHWVSGDFYIYKDHAACFNLSDEQIAQLPIVKMKKFIFVDNKKNRMMEIDLDNEENDFKQISEMIRRIRYGEDEKS